MIYILILVILILILIVYVIPFKIQIYYEFDQVPTYNIVVSYFFGLVKFKFNPISKKYEDIEKTDKRININKRLKYLHYFVDKGKIEKLYFRVNLGFEDPALLGISIGFAWSIINLAFGYLFKDKDIDKIKEKDIQVIPLFDHNVFELYFLCIIKVKLVYIITEYFRILKNRKGGDSSVRTPNRRINESYNE